LGRLFSRRSFVLLAPTFVLLALAQQSMLSWLPAYFQRSFDIQPAALGLQLSIYQGIPLLAGTLTGGFTTDRLSAIDQRWIVWAPMSGALLAAPAAIGVFTAGGSALAF